MIWTPKVWNLFFVQHVWPRIFLVYLEKQIFEEKHSFILWKRTGNLFRWGTSKLAERIQWIMPLCGSMHLLFSFTNVFIMCKPSPCWNVLHGRWMKKSIYYDGVHMNGRYTFNEHNKGKDTVRLTRISQMGWSIRYQKTKLFN